MSWLFLRLARFAHFLPSGPITTFSMRWPSALRHKTSFLSNGTNVHDILRKLIIPLFSVRAVALRDPSASAVFFRLWGYRHWPTKLRGRIYLSLSLLSIAQTLVDNHSSGQTATVSDSVAMSQNGLGLFYDAPAEVIQSESLPHPAMSTASFRSNRIIIASLFLPNTVVIGFEPSGKSTPVPGRHPGPPLAIASNTGPDATEVVLRLKGDAAGNTTGVISQAPNKVVASKNTPLKSIVEDLKDRAMAPRIATKIGSENLNPFSNLASITTPAATSPNSPHSRAASLSKAATTTPVVVAPPMVQSPSRRRSKAARRNSRSSSRRPEGSLVAEDSREEIEQFFVEPNPHCNGGLKNAIESVSTVNGASEFTFIFSL